MADTAHEVIAPRRFVLLSPDGKVRAQLGVIADGGAGLAVYDSDGHARACLTVERDGEVSLGLHDRADRPPEVVSVNEDGSLKLRFADQRVKTRAMLGGGMRCRSSGRWPS